MTYHGRELLVSRSSPHQHSHSQRRTVNNSNNCWYPSRFSPSQTLRIDCQGAERHFIGDPSSYTINSSLQPIHFTMNDHLKPVHFRSQIIVHNNPQTDIHIERLSVAFQCHEDPPIHSKSKRHRSTPPKRSHSLHTPKSSLSHRHQQNDTNDSRQTLQSVPSPHSQELLHQWIDDICANQQLMSNDDIVFFIKNGEFFARI